MSGKEMEVLVKLMEGIAELNGFDCSRKEIMKAVYTLKEDRLITELSELLYEIKSDAEQSC